MSVLMQWEETGTLRRIMPPAGEHGDCRKAEILFLAGTGITDAGGRWSLDVGSALCGVHLGNVTWVSMVATPSERLLGHPNLRPVTVTTYWEHSVPVLTLHVQSWDCRCERAPEVEFGYHVAIGRILDEGHL